MVVFPAVRPSRYPDGQPHKIATNVCLKALEPRPIRLLPSGLAGPYDGPDRPPNPIAPGEVSWLEPLPDAWISPPTDDPAAVVVERESLRLALIASMQHLPARQRVYRRDAEGVLRVDGAVVLAPTATGISGVIKFHDPALVAAFGFPLDIGD